MRLIITLLACACLRLSSAGSLFVLGTPDQITWSGGSGLYVAGFGTNNSGSATNDMDGIVADWPLQTFSTASSPDLSGNNAYVTNAAGGTVYLTNSPIGNAMYFKTGSLVAPTLASNFYSTITVCCWFKPDQTSRGDLITRWLNGASINDSFDLLWGVTASTPQMFVTSGSDSAGSSTSTTFSTGSWIFVAATYDGTTLLVYTNGSLYTTTTPGVGGLPTSLGRTIILGNDTAGDGQFVGAEYDARFYSKVKTAAQINNIYKWTQSNQ